MKTLEKNTMKRSFLLPGVLMAVLFVAAISGSCTNLDEELYSEVTPENFFNTQEEFISALGAAYTQFSGWATGGTLDLQSMSTDEMVVPTRGQDWDDGGDWRRLHLHSWTKEDGKMNNIWDFGFSGVNTANRLIFQFQSLVETGQVDQASADAFIAELEAVRGFFYWQLIDVYGNVPLVTDFGAGEAAPPTKTRLEVYNWLVSNLETAVPKLSKAVDGTTYGRMNYYAGQMLLAKLYLNAKVYSGTEQLDKTIAACDEIINSGKYSLENNYFANFNVNNSSSKEFVFAIPYDQVFFQGFAFGVSSLHYGNQFTYNLTQQPWNGYCALEEFYNSYSDEDLRKGDAGTTTGPAVRRGNFIAGYQWRSDGNIVVDDGFEAPQPGRQPVPLLGDPDGAPVNLGNIGSGQPQINELGPQAYRQAGVRVGKWEYEMGADPANLNNDYAVFRYADVLLMKSEALWRKNLDEQALPLVNQIRRRAGLTTDLTSLDGPLFYDLTGPVVDGGELYNEIGREMFAENHKRTNMIRWGIYTDLEKWILPHYNPTDVVEDDPKTNLLPIPKDKIAANPNLQQNPGY